MLSTDPTASVLVTVYNREQYLAATLDSVLASSITDFEVIVVDDCSTDASAKIASEFAGHDKRVRFVRNDQNLGDYGNRMNAASLARGRYLKYVDSDDLIYPHSLQVMVDAMEQHADAAVGLAHSMPEDEKPYPWKLTPEETYRKHFLGRGCLSCGPTGAIIRKSAFEQVGGFRKEWGVLSDTDLWLRLAATLPVVLLPPGLVWWRRHEDQEFTKDNADEVYMAQGHNLDLASLKSEACPLGASQTAQAVNRRKQHYARKLLGLASRQLRPFFAAKLFHQSQLTVRDLASGFRKYH